MLRPLAAFSPARAGLDRGDSPHVWQVGIGIGSVIVELAGLPGSGKTTIAPLLVGWVPSLQRRVLEPHWRDVWRQPSQGLIEATRSTAWGRRCGWPAWPALALLAAGQRRSPTVDETVDLLEEGIIHHVWRTRFLHPGLDAAPWQGLLDVPHPVVVLECDRAARFGRLAGKRGKGPVNRQMEAAGPHGALWDHAERLFAEILDVVEKTRRVERVSTMVPVEEAVQRVAGAIGRLR